MPEEVTEKPKIYTTIETSKPSSLDWDILERVRIEDLRNHVLRTREILLQGNPRSATLVENTFNLMHGLLFVHETEHAQSPSEKVFAARVQHIIVHNAIYGSSYRASQDYARNLYSFLHTLELQVTRYGEQKTNMIVFSSGAKTELAIVKTLTDEGLCVYVPDYTPSFDSQNPDANEVYQLDIRSGIDFITIVERGDQRVAVLLNAKGFSGASGVSVRRESARDLNYFVRRTLDNLGVSAVAKGEITICTKGLGFGKSVLGRDYREAIANSCDLSVSSRSAIVDGVENLARLAISGVYA